MFSFFLMSNNYLEKIVSRENLSNFAMHERIYYARTNLLNTIDFFYTKIVKK